MRVYVVTSGQYSDFGIEQVFSTREKADEYMRLAKQYGHGDLNDEIDEYEMDPEITIPRKKFKYFYYITMDKEGNTRNTGQRQEGIIKGSEIEKQQYYFYVDYYPKTESVLTATVNADSEEHAIKILNEKRIHILAANGWPSDAVAKEGWRIKTKF